MRAYACNMMSRSEWDYDPVRATSFMEMMVKRNLIEDGITGEPMIHWRYERWEQDAVFEVRSWEEWDVLVCTATVELA